MHNHSIITLLKRIWQHIRVRRRRKFAILLCLTVISACAEVLSLGAIVPFIGILTQPEKVLSAPLFSGLVQIFGIKSGEELVLPLALSFALAALLAGTMRLILLSFGIRLANATGADLSIEVYRRTLYQSYSIHIARSSSEIISGITQKVSTATSVLISAVAVITSAVLFVAILGALILVDPMSASVAAIAFGVAYAGIALRTRRRLVWNSNRIAQEQTQVVKALQEGLGAIRDVLLDNTQEIYCNVYQAAIIKLQRAIGENTFINQAPRYAIEALGMVMIACFALALSNRSGGVAGAIPVLGVLALGAQRLLPIMQQLYGNWAVVAGSAGALADVLVLLDQPLPEHVILQPKPEPLELEKSIQFEDVSFQYDGNPDRVIDGVQLTIPKGARVGVVGASGSGKSTFIDLLMGLLEPTSGRILIDGTPISHFNQRAWQRSVAHVPQSIFLKDGSITENIAFGVPIEEIDNELVSKAATQARISDFIEKRSAGYNAIVGERGALLSGGQRQRIGIARALYKNASVLVFDEVTSALDTDTELAFMEEIKRIGSDKTIVIVAHRLSTLSFCDYLIRISSGKVELIEVSGN